MAILIDNQQENHPIEIQKLEVKAQAILDALDCQEGELSILIVDDLRIAEINQAYLNHSGPTNVISFSMREGEFGDINPHLLGDVIISADTCAMEAQEASITMETRLDQLLIHGILHIFGYDHIHSEADAKAMEAKSNELVAMVNAIILKKGRTM